MRAEHFLLCPDRLNVSLLRYGKGIIDIDAEIPDSALYLGVAEQKLHRSQIPGAAVDERCFSPPQ
jgi:MinD superfamily P-loop ATPase